MDLDFDDEQLAFRDVVRDFADNKIAPLAEAWDREREFPLEVIGDLGELGVFGVAFPPEYGGAGGDFVTFCLAVEELARVDSSIAVTVEAAVGLGATPIMRFGTEEQRQQWLPDLVSGRALAAFGLTEPDGGSDAAATRTRATPDTETGEWVIDGEKAFITNCGTPLTSLVTVTARTGSSEINTIVVPVGTPGMDVQPAYRKMGWHASDTHPIAFHDCRVPDSYLLGERGAGLRQFLAVLDEGRVAIAALACGTIQGCLDHAVAYATEREAFGGPIGRNQAVAFKCADLAVSLDAARALTYRAAWLRDQGRDFRREAAVAKLVATEAAVDATRQAAQVLGGASFLDDTWIARAYRDSKILEIGEGTSEIQRLVIARQLGLPV